MYILLKKHKLGPSSLPSVSATETKVCPISFGFNGSADGFNWLSNRILTPFLQCISAHLSRTAKELRKLVSIIPDERTHTESFNVEALYTNVNNEDAVTCLL